MNYVDHVIQCCWILETSAPNLITLMFGYHQVEHEIKFPLWVYWKKLLRTLLLPFDLNTAGLIAI